MEDKDKLEEVKEEVKDEVEEVEDEVVEYATMEQMKALDDKIAKVEELANRLEQAYKNNFNQKAKEETVVVEDEEEEVFTLEKIGV